MLIVIQTTLAVVLIFVPTFLTRKQAPKSAEPVVIGAQGD
jgi:hypothetical protein